MTTPFLLGSYLTVEEYRAAPTALRTNNLVPGADQPTQDAELAALISKASRKLDEWARQPLYATAATQNDADVRIRQGDAILHAHQDRVKTLTSFAWGCRWTSMTTVGNPACFIEENRVRVALNAAGTTWSGSLNLGQPLGGTVFVSWGFVAGWATTRLSADVAEGASTFTVDNPAGIVPGTMLTLTDADGASKANVTVASLTGDVVTPTAPVPQSFDAGGGVAESEDIKQGGILLVSHYIQERQGGGINMSKTPTEAKADDGISDYEQAREIALRWQRVTP